MTKNWNLKEKPTSWILSWPHFQKPGERCRGLVSSPSLLVASFQEAVFLRVLTEPGEDPRRERDSPPRSALWPKERKNPFFLSSAKGEEESWNISLDYHDFQITGSIWWKSLQIQTLLSAKNNSSMFLNYQKPNFRYIVLFSPWTLKNRDCVFLFQRLPAKFPKQRHDTCRNLFKYSLTH